MLYYSFMSCYEIYKKMGCTCLVRPIFHEIGLFHVCEPIYYCLTLL